MCPNITEIKKKNVWLFLQTFNSTDATEEFKAEEVGLDEKSPSASSMTEHTLYRQKSKSFIGSEKGQENAHKDSVQVKYPAVYISQYTFIHPFIQRLKEWPKSSLYRTGKYGIINRCLDDTDIVKAFHRILSLCRRKRSQKCHSSKYWVWIRQNGPTWWWASSVRSSMEACSRLLLLSSPKLLL